MSQKSLEEEYLRRLQRELRDDALDPYVVETKEYDARGVVAVNKFDRQPNGIVVVNRTVRRRVTWWSRLIAWMRAKR